MNKILNVLFAIIIGFILSVIYLSYNNLQDINQEITKKIQEVKKIKQNIKEINKEIQKKNKAIEEITKDFSIVKENVDDKIEKNYYLVIEKKFNSDISESDFDNSKFKIAKWKERLFIRNIKTSYKKDIKKTYKISWNKFSLFTGNLADIDDTNPNNYIINIVFNYNINESKIFDMLKTIYRSYNIKFIASNYQQLFTYLKNVNISYDTKNKLEILNIIDVINKYKILFNNEENQKVEEKLKNILYKTMK